MNGCCMLLSSRPFIHLEQGSSSRPLLQWDEVGHVDLHLNVCIRPTKVNLMLSFVQKIASHSIKKQWASQVFASLLSLLLLSFSSNQMKLIQNCFCHRFPVSIQKNHSNGKGPVLTEWKLKRQGLISQWTKNGQKFWAFWKSLRIWLSILWLKWNGVSGTWLRLCIISQKS